MEIIKTTALITINETLWVQMIVFLIFLFLVNRIMFRPVRRNLAEREAHFATLRGQIEGLEEEMTALLDAAEAEERQLRNSAHRIVEDLRKDGQHEAQRLLEDILEDVKRRQKAAEQDLEADLERARRRVEAESDELTRHIVHHLTQPGSVP